MSAWIFTAALLGAGLFGGVAAKADEAEIQSPVIARLSRPVFGPEGARYTLSFEMDPGWFIFGVEKVPSEKDVEKLEVSIADAPEYELHRIDWPPAELFRTPEGVDSEGYGASFNVPVFVRRRLRTEEPSDLTRPPDGFIVDNPDRQTQGGQPQAPPGESLQDGLPPKGTVLVRWVASNGKRCIPGKASLTFRPPVPLPVAKPG